MSTKIKIAFYKDIGKPINFTLSSYTGIFTWGVPSYSHVEIGFFINGEWKYFSSTMRDGAKGTRWISSKDLFKHRERWDVYDYEAKKDQEEMLSRIRSIIPAKYDMWGILGFVTPLGLVNSFKAWYCSEACWYVLFEWMKRISPKRMYKLLKKDLELTDG